jgi:hypothetical protein
MWGGDGEVRYAFLGKTEGKGTYQFNAETMKAMGRMLSQTQGGQRVNYVFGEGVNPQLRHLRDGLDELGLPANALLRHGTPLGSCQLPECDGYLVGMEGGRRKRVKGKRQKEEVGGERTS